MLLMRMLVLCVSECVGRQLQHALQLAPANCLHANCLHAAAKHVAAACKQFLCEFCTYECHRTSAEWLSTACMALKDFLAIYLFCQSHKQFEYALEMCSVIGCKVAVDVCQAAAERCVVTMQ